ncbi:MAG: polysaccharide biosynthesis protein [Kiritimatiellia bacterium]
MVTGAGGSIGSELCRQIAPLGPARLILFENSEFALYTLHLELTRAFPDLRVEAVAGDVRLPEDCRDALTRHGRVSVIFHAAAYKHVHLMEHNIPTAFHNNVLSTARLADAAVRHGVSDFILISSDKAVRPTSIMGATKRLAERLLMERPPGGTVFRAVRFGNVMGSSGSVIPCSSGRSRNANRSPSPRPGNRRYFMTIPEAVELVLMAGAVGGDRDIMVLEMGEPVKILDLAEKLIELSGYIPYRDIPIVFTGLRPGEKEYEELITDRKTSPAPSTKRSGS